MTDVAENASPREAAEARRVEVDEFLARMRRTVALPARGDETGRRTWVRHPLRRRSADYCSRLRMACACSRCVAIVARVARMIPITSSLTPPPAIMRSRLVSVYRCPAICASM
jgi:hypothetical protein